MEAPMPRPSSFSLTFFFVKGQAPSASLMGIKVFLPPHEGSTRLSVTHPSWGAGAPTSAGHVSPPVPWAWSCPGPGTYTRPMLPDILERGPQPSPLT